MKRYDSTNTIRVVVPPEQKDWLRSKATGMQTISDVIRCMIKQSMDFESRGILPATGYRKQA